MSISTPHSNGIPQQNAQSGNNGLALYSLMMLFFMMGFITCLNDILIPYMKAIFQLNFAQANFINLCFFGAYFIMSVPSGMLIQRIGYKGGMITGFIIAAFGCFLFYPAASSREYSIFLAALFILASGITMLQVAGNPYVAVLGPVESSSARLTLTQAFNSVGTTIAPFIGASLILANLPKDLSNINTIDVSAVQVPYLYIGVALVIIAGILWMLKLPAIGHGEGEIMLSGSDKGSAWNYRHLTLGAIGIFAYVGAEVAIGSHITSYLNHPDVMGMPMSEAGKYVAFYWGGAMVGRFIGAWILRQFDPGKVLAFNAGMAMLLILISMSTTGAAAMWSILLVGLMNSLMFATIFTLAVKGLGKYTDQGSGILSTAIVGGAVVPFLYGLMSDASSLRLAFVLPLLCYVYIGWYGLKGNKETN